MLVQDLGQGGPAVADGRGHVWRLRRPLLSRRHGVQLQLGRHPGGEPQQGLDGPRLAREEPGMRGDEALAPGGDGQPEVRVDGPVERVSRDEAAPLPHPQAAQERVDGAPAEGEGWLAAGDQVHRRIEGVALAPEGVGVATGPVVALHHQHPPARLGQQGRAVRPPMPLPTTTTS